MWGVSGVQTPLACKMDIHFKLKARDSNFQQLRTDCLAAMLVSHVHTHFSAVSQTQSVPPLHMTDAARDSTCTPSGLERT